VASCRMEAAMAAVEVGEGRRLLIAFKLAVRDAWRVFARLPDPDARFRAGLRAGWSMSVVRDDATGLSHVGLYPYDSLASYTTGKSSPLLRQARSRAGAIPSSCAIRLNGRPLLAAAPPPPA
jgi:hypothetical protein